MHHTTRYLGVIAGHHFHTTWPYACQRLRRAWGMREARMNSCLTASVATRVWLQGAPTLTANARLSGEQRKSFCASLHFQVYAFLIHVHNVYTNSPDSSALSMNHELTTVTIQYLNQRLRRTQRGTTDVGVNERANVSVNVGPDNNSPAMCGKVN